MNVNCCANEFKNELRTFYKTNDLAFVYDGVFNTFGIGCSNPDHLYKGDNEVYTSFDFERILNNLWNKSPMEESTRCEIYVSGRVVWCARKVVFGPHHCSSNCIKESQAQNEFFDEVTESTCLYLRYKVLRRHQSFQESFSNDKQIVLLEVLDFFMDSVHDILRYKKLSKHATAPTRATAGSVGYDLYSAVGITLSVGCCVLAATDIALQCPKGVYPRVAPRSGMACRFTDVGTSMVDIDYTGNVKVVMMNHSEQDIEVAQGQRIAQFVLTRYEVPETVEVQSFKPTERDTGGFGSTGIWWLVFVVFSNSE